MAAGAVELLPSTVAAEAAAARTAADPDAAMADNAGLWTPPLPEVTPAGAGVATSSSCCSQDCHQQSCVIHSARGHKGHHHQIRCSAGHKVSKPQALEQGTDMSKEAAAALSSSRLVDHTDQQLEVNSINATGALGRPGKQTLLLWQNQPR